MKYEELAAIVQAYSEEDKDNRGVIIFTSQKIGSGYDCHGLTAGKKDTIVAAAIGMIKTYPDVINVALDLIVHSKAKQVIEQKES